MTSNQIAYASYRESRRHNVQTENLTHEANTELARHNRAGEGIDYYNATTNRINARTNSVNASTNAFNAQTNYYKALTEREKLTETKRHNKADERISAGQFSVSVLGQNYKGNYEYYPIIKDKKLITNSGGAW